MLIYFFLVFFLSISTSKLFHKIVVLLEKAELYPAFLLKMLLYKCFHTDDI